ncbi:glycoside hydrolase family 38 C-terminal domain-containing protein [Clavibacter tessellarius]
MGAPGERGGLRPQPRRARRARGGRDRAGHGAGGRGRRGRRIRRVRGELDRPRAHGARGGARRIRARARRGARQRHRAARRGGAGLARRHDARRRRHRARQRAAPRHDRRARPRHVDRRPPPRRPRVSCPPVASRTCSSCTRTSPRRGTPGTSTRTTARAAPTWSRRPRSSLVEDSPLRATVEVVRQFGRSRVVQRVSLHADDARIHATADLDWLEDEKLLKVSFPLTIHAQHHSAEIQFGHVRRPTHTNTSWDEARFEVMAHRFVHVEEPGYGVALTNAGSYGHDITRSVGATGEVETEMRISLVRAARSPTPCRTSATTASSTRSCRASASRARWTRGSSRTCPCASCTRATPRRPRPARRRPPRSPRRPGPTPDPASPCPRRCPPPPGSSRCTAARCGSRR